VILRGSNDWFEWIRREPTLVTDNPDANSARDDFRASITNLMPTAPDEEFRASITSLERHEPSRTHNASQMGVQNRRPGPTG